MPLTVARHAPLQREKITGITSGERGRDCPSAYQNATRASAKIRQGADVRGHRHARATLTYECRERMLSESTEPVLVSVQLPLGVRSFSWANIRID
jgi:hypothetical protein